MASLGYFDREHTFKGPGGHVFYYDGSPEDLETAIRESELETELP